MDRIDADLPSAVLHDHVTGLPNEALLFDRLDMARRRMSRTAEPLAVIHCGLEPLTDVRDRAGEDARDEVLATIARRFEASIRSSDTAARIGAHDVLLVCERLRDARAVDLIIDRLIDAAATPITVGWNEFRIPVSLGVVITNDAGYPTEQLLSEAGALEQEARYGAAPHVRVADWNLSLLREAAVILDARAHA